MRGKKIIAVPANIFDTLTPVALAFWILFLILYNKIKKNKSGDRRHGLVLCTHSFTFKDTVILLNVLVIKFRLECTIQQQGTQYFIYVRESSIPLLLRAAPLRENCYTIPP